MDMLSNFNHVFQPSSEEILASADLIGPYVHKTPVLTSTRINEKVGASLFFKCENFQKAGAFKSRGAVNAVLNLPDDKILNGVCTHSSGNHAAALARAASLRDVKAYIVMPENAPLIKIAAVKSYGGHITFCQPTLKAREETLKEIVKKTGSVEIHPYNNEEVIKGQASCGMELIHEIPDLDNIICPVGGGGLLSGTLISVNHFSPEIKVIAAEPKGASDAYQSMVSGQFIPSENPQTIADGLLTSLGSLTYPVIMKYVNDIVTVKDAIIIDAMRIIWERMKIIVEPSSAVTLAVILKAPERFKGKKIGLILSGGNVDLEKLPWL